MFNKLDLNNPKDRRKLFFFILFLFTTVVFGFQLLFSLFSSGEEVPGPTVEEKADPSGTSSPPPSTDGAEPEEELSKKELEESKKTVSHFLESYLPYDGKEPLKYVEKSKEYMTEDLYLEKEASWVRPTADRNKVKLLSIEHLEMETEGGMASSKDKVYWMASVLLEVTDLKGKKQKKETGYAVFTVQESQEWKVGGVEEVGSFD